MPTTSAPASSASWTAAEPTPPAGYCAVESGGETYQLDGDRALGEFSPERANHFRNVFVVRDGDLRIREHHAFYGSGTERIGDLHTSEIEAVKNRLEELGRVTPGRWDVSSDKQYHSAADVRDDARALATEVREYIETAENEGLDPLESELVER